MRDETQREEKGHPALERQRVRERERERTQNFYLDRDTYTE